MAEDERLWTAVKNLESEFGNYSECGWAMERWEQVAQLVARASLRVARTPRAVSLRYRRLIGLREGASLQGTLSAEEFPEATAGAWRNVYAEASRCMQVARTARRPLPSH